MKRSVTTFSQKESHQLSTMPSREQSSSTVGHQVEKNLNDSSAETNNNRNNASVIVNPLLGLFYVLLSSILFNIVTVIVKKVSYISTSQHALVRNFGLIAGSIPVIVYCDVQWLGHKKDRIMLVLRGLSSAATIFMSFIAYRYLPLIEACVIMSTTPTVVTTIARIFLKESCGIMQIICLLLTLTGVLLTLRIPELLRVRDNIRFDSSYLGGLAAAIATTILFAITTIALRKLKDVHFAIPTLYSGFLGMVLQSVINGVAFPYAAPLCGWDSMLCFSVGFFGFLAAICYTLALQKQPAGVAAVERDSFDIIVSIIYQILFFYSYPDVYVLSGALVVLISIVIMGIRNFLLVQPEDSTTRKRFRWFLL